jgi:glyoxylate/hydroxypyruvate reductase
VRPIIPFLARTPADNQSAWLSALALAMPTLDIRPFNTLSVQERAQTRVAIVANPDPKDLATLPNLAWIQSLWAGVEQLVGNVLDPNLQIVRLIDPELANTMAEAVLAWTLYLHRNMPTYQAQQAQGIWQDVPYISASERTIGILGLGQLGRAAAKRLLANGFQVRGWSRTPVQIDGMTCFSRHGGLVELLQTIDSLVILLPLTPETTGIIDSEKLSLMKNGASLINFGRGPIVDTRALVAALDDRHIAHAVLDVFDQEPLPASSDLWAHPHITILPHISAPTNKATASQIVASNITEFLATGAIPTPVNRIIGY